MNYIELCDKIDQNYHYYQRDRSRYSNFYSISYKAMFFFRFIFVSICQEFFKITSIIQKQQSLFQM